MQPCIETQILTHFKRHAGVQRRLMVMSMQILCIEHPFRSVIGRQVA